MKERKYVKFRVDMYDDTKFKMIDMKPERDLIHYVWTRLIALAGKVNLEGELYLSKNIPYTAETLAIEFNRDTFQVKSALNTLIELEMLEITEDNVYRVKNFAKHQNIKVKEKNKLKDKEEEVVGNEEAKLKQNLEEDNDANKMTEDRTEKVQEERNNANLPYENVTTNNVVNKFSNVQDKPNIIENQKSIDGKQDDSPILLDDKQDTGAYKRKNRSRNKPKNKSTNKIKDKSCDITDEEKDEISVAPFTEGDFERTLEPGESVMEQWVF